MIKYVLLAGIFNRRKDRLPVPQDRRRVTCKAANAMLHESIDRLQETINQAIGGQKK